MTPDLQGRQPTLACAAAIEPVGEPDLGRIAHIAAGLQLTVSSEQRSQLLQFTDLLLRWNRVYNLTAVRERDAIIVQHLADCLALVPPLMRHADHHPVARVLDVGSGGGLPGVVIAIMNPQVEVTCVDAVAKKTAFVSQVAAGLKLQNLRSRHGRVERLAHDADGYDVITARAFASLADLVALTEPMLSVGGVWLAMKGMVPAAELNDLPTDVRVFHVEPLVVPLLDAQRCLVWMRRTEAVEGCSAIHAVPGVPE